MSEAEGVYFGKQVGESFADLGDVGIHDLVGKQRRPCFAGPVGGESECHGVCFSE